MEALWMVPLYLLIPLLAITFIVIGGLKKSRNKIKLGLILLAFPFLHLLMMHFTDVGIENKLVGNYTIDNKIPKLTLKDDGTFNLQKSSNYSHYGKGTWDVKNIGIYILELNFDNQDGSLSFEFDENGNPIELNAMATPYRFIKTD